MNIDLNALEYKTDVLNSETHSDIYLIWKTTFTNFLSCNLQLKIHVNTKILVHNRDHLFRISHSYTFILIN
jgi:hypothetical protein